MIDFKNVEITDKKWIDPLLAAADYRGCHQNFTNIFAWAGIYQYRVSEVQGYLVVKGYYEEMGHYYFYPAGRGNIESVLAALKADADANGHKFILAGLSAEDKKVLDSLFPGKFSYRADRDEFDYIYLLDKLVSLSGKKLQAKRNHINRFKANYNWVFEPITPDNLAECWKMNLEWCRRHHCSEDQQLADEHCAVRLCFEYFVPLGLEGGIIRVDDKIVAFTMGEVLNSDIYDIHIEKAFSEYPGAYQMINREFAAFIKERHPQIIYVNREDDLGYEGLRKAKLSYHPYMLEEKYTAFYQD